jgi:hypothetical protein
MMGLEPTTFCIAIGRPFLPQCRHFRSNVPFARIYSWLQLTHGMPADGA